MPIVTILWNWCCSKLDSTLNLSLWVFFIENFYLFRPCNFILLYVAFLFHDLIEFLAKIIFVLEWILNNDFISCIIQVYHVDVKIVLN